MTCSSCINHKLNFRSNTSSSATHIHLKDSRRQWCYLFSHCLNVIFSALRCTKKKKEKKKKKQNFPLLKVSLVLLLNFKIVFSLLVKVKCPHIFSMAAKSRLGFAQRSLFKWWPFFMDLVSGVVGPFSIAVESSVCSCSLL